MASGMMWVMSMRDETICQFLTGACAIRVNKQNSEWLNGLRMEKELKAAADVDLPVMDVQNRRILGEFAVGSHVF